MGCQRGVRVGVAVGVIVWVRDNSPCDSHGSGLDMDLQRLRDGSTPYRCKFHQSSVQSLFSLVFCLEQAINAYLENRDDKSPH